LVKFIVAVFIVLHGLVHLLYVAQSQRLLELQPEMVWPDGSWAFAQLLGSEATRWLASVSYALATVGFVVGGVALFAQAGWWRPFVTGSAALSAAMVLLLWDRQLHKLSDQGWIALLIDAAILVAVLLLRWPSG
jgi:hypothetical protein